MKYENGLYMFPEPERAAKLLEERLRQSRHYITLAVILDILFLDQYKQYRPHYLIATDDGIILYYAGPEGPGKTPILKITFRANELVIDQPRRSYSERKDILHMSVADQQAHLDYYISHPDL